MAMVATRTMAAKLNQKIPVAVQRAFASSRARATSGNCAAAVNNPEPRRVLYDVQKIVKNNRGNDALAAASGICFGGIFMSYMSYRMLNA